MPLVLDQQAQDWQQQQLDQHINNFFPESKPPVPAVAGGAAAFGLGGGGLTPAPAAPSPDLTAGAGAPGPQQDAAPPAVPPETAPTPPVVSTPPPAPAPTVDPAIQSHIDSLFSGSDNTLADGSPAQPGGVSGSFPAPDQAASGTAGAVAGGDSSPSTAPSPPAGPAPTVPPEIDQHIQNLFNGGQPTAQDVNAPFTTPATPAFTPPPVPAATIQPPAPVPAGDLTPNQFGDPTLTASEALAACGPAAAVAFARANGREPTLREAQDLAEQTGWTASGGMNGIANEQALLTKMGVQTNLSSTVDWHAISQQASHANPIIVSTPGHYFVVSGYDPTSGKYFVGNSGTAYRQGSPWLTPEQMSALAGAPQGMLTLGQPASNPIQQAADTIGSTVGGAASALGSDVQSGINAAGQAASAVGQARDAGLASSPAASFATTPLPAGPINSTIQAGEKAIGSYVGAQNTQTAADRATLNKLILIPPDQWTPQQEQDWQDASGRQAMTVFGGSAPEDATVQAAKAAASAATPAVKGALDVLGSGAKQALGVGLDYADQAAAKGVPGAAEQIAQQELNAGLTPKSVINAATPLGQTIQNVLAPIKKAVPAAQDAFTSLANVIGGQSQGAGVAADTLQGQIQQVLGDTDSAQAADIMRTFEKTGQFFTDPTPEQAALADKLDAYFQQTGDLGRAQPDALRYVKGDVTKADVPGAWINDASQVQPGDRVWSGDSPITVTRVTSTGKVFAGDGTPGGTHVYDPTTLRLSATPPNHYFPHVWAEDDPLGAGATNEEAAAAASQQSTPATTNMPAASPRSMNPNSFYTLGRKYLTVDDAIAAGKTPTSVSDAVATYTRGIEASQAKAQFITDLQANAPETIQAVDKQHPMPQGWISGLSIDPRTNSPLAGYAFDPSVGVPLKNLLGISQIANNPIGSALLNTVNAGKRGVFNLSLFHAYTLGLTTAIASPGSFQQVAHAAISPDFFTGLRYGGLADVFNRAAKAGVTGLLGTGTSDVPVGDVLAQRLSGAAVAGVGSAGASIDRDISNKQDAGTIWKDAALWGSLGAVGGAAAAPVISDALWQRAVPIAKATMWDQAVKNGMSEQEAADFANRTLGGLNYDAMGRNKDLQNTLRLLVMAPDWNESTIRTLGASIFGKDSAAAASRDLVMKATLLPLAVMEIINRQTTGHSMLQNDPGHQLEIQVPPNPNTPAKQAYNTYYTGLPGNIASYFTDALKLGTAVAGANPNAAASASAGFATNRLSWPISNYFSIQDGFPLKPGQGAARYASAVAPISVQAAISAPQHGANPALTGAASLVGANPKYAKPVLPPYTAPAGSSAGMNR